MQVNNTTLILVLMNIIMIVNASIHFATGAGIINFCNSVDQPNNNTQFYDLQQPYFSYLFTIGSLMFVYVCVNCLSFFVDSLNANYIFAMVSWVLSWLVVMFNFGAGVVMAFDVSFQMQGLKQTGYYLFQKPGPYQQMFKLFMADTIITFVLGFAASIVLLHFNNYQVAKAITNSKIQLGSTKRRESELSQKFIQS